MLSSGGLRSDAEIALDDIRELRDASTEIVSSAGSPARRFSQPLVEFVGIPADCSQANLEMHRKCFLAFEPPNA